MDNINIHFANKTMTTVFERTRADRVQKLLSTLTWSRRKYWANGSILTRYDTTIIADE